MDVFLRGFDQSYKYVVKYLSRKAILLLKEGNMRGSNGRKRVIITRQPIVSPSHVDNYSVDSVSLDSFDRPTSSPSKTVNFHMNSFIYLEFLIIDKNYSKNRIKSSSRENNQV